MKAEDKAIDLYNKFLEFASPLNKEDRIYVLSHKANAKQCALICVEEKIKLLQRVQDEMHSDYFFTVENEIFELQEVKQEIEKL